MHVIFMYNGLPRKSSSLEKMVSESAVYGLPQQIRCLAPLSGEQERNRWLLCSFCPNNQNKIYLADFDEDTEQISILMMDHPERITSITANPKDTNQFITCYDDSASLWQIDDHVPNEPFQSETAHPLKKLASFPATHAIKSAIWSSSKKVLGYSPKSASIFEVGTGGSSIAISSCLSLPNEGDIFCAAWNPLGEKLLAIGKGRSILEIDCRSNQKQFEIADAHEINVRAVDYNHNKPNSIVSGGDDCMIRIWDTRYTKSPLKELSDHSHWIWSVQFNRFHDQLLLSCSSDTQVNLQSIVSVSSTPVKSYSPIIQTEDESESEQTVDGLVKTYEQHEDSVYNAAWSPSDPWIFASVSFDGRFVVNFVPQEHKYKIIM